MDNLFKLLLVLFASLALLVLLLERFGSPMSEQQQSRYARWILPLVALLVIVQLVRHFWN